MKKILNEQIAVTDANPIRARFYCYPRFTYPWHFHSEYELMYVECGHGQCLVGDSIIDFQEGDVILFGSELPHCMQSAPEYGTDEQLYVKGVNIQFEKDFMQYSFSHYIQFTSIRNLLENAHRGISFSLRQAPHTVEMLNLIPQTQGVDQIVLILSLLQALASFPQKQYAASPNYLLTPSLFSNKKMERVISYLNKRYTQPVSLNEIASFTAMNPAAFCRYFKEHTGKTFKQYILEMRIGYACKLLAADRLNISQISLECGFESITPFNRSFKKITGLTPTQYKEKVNTL